MKQRVRLSLLAESDTARDIAITLTDPQRPLIIGRGAGVDLDLHDPTVAARHCQLCCDEHGLRLENLDLTQSTWHNGSALEGSAQLHDGDRIQIGKLSFRVQFRTSAEKPADSRMSNGRDFDTASDSGATQPSNSGMPRDPHASPGPSPSAPPRPFTPEPLASPARSRDGRADASNSASVTQISDRFVRKALEELTAKNPARAARFNQRELQILIERGRDLARQLGFLAEEEMLQLLHCAILLDGGLADLTAKNSDLFFTLTNATQAPAARLKRALRIAQRQAEKRFAESPPSARPPRSITEETVPMDSHPPQRSGKSGSKERRSGGKLEPPPPAESTRSTPPPDPDHAADTPSLPQIDGFTLIGKIGEGGMSYVYKARDQQLDIEVAIKVLRSMQGGAQEQFLREARAAAKLQHPNIVQVLRYDRYGEGGYCVMQLIPGKNADQLVEIFSTRIAHTLTGPEILALALVDAGSIGPELRACLEGLNAYYRIVAQWMAGVADGLQRAHNEGVIHRDIKPKNLMMSRDGRMLLTDFGLATLKGDKLPGSSFCVGTPRYLSPEMLAGWASRSGVAHTDARVDIWGLGASLYEFLAFRPAYLGSMEYVLKDIACCDPRPPRELVWQVPAELEVICLKALQRNPEHRYQKASEMAEDLRGWIAGKAPTIDRSTQGSLWDRLKGLRQGRPKDA